MMLKILRGMQLYGREDVWKASYIRRKILKISCMGWEGRRLKEKIFGDGGREDTRIGKLGEKEGSWEKNISQEVV